MGTSGRFLAIEGLSKTFQNENESKTVLEGVDLELAFRDCLAIVGPSGCGKTTLLLAIAGLIPPTAGTITFREGPLADRERRIALVLQHYGLFPWKTVGDNITSGHGPAYRCAWKRDCAPSRGNPDIEGLDHLYRRSSRRPAPACRAGKGASSNPCLLRRTPCRHRHRHAGAAQNNLTSSPSGSSASSSSRTTSKRRYSWEGGSSSSTAMPADMIIMDHPGWRAKYRTTGLLRAHHRTQGYPEGLE